MTDEERRTLTPGARVALRGRRWHVEQLTPHVDCQSLRLRASDSPGRARSQTFLVPFDQPSSIDAPRGIRVLRRQAYFRCLRELLLSSHPFGSLRSAGSADVELQPFQTEPALAMLRHARLRLFIADAVGLGKTIQAGLILNEFAARDDYFRALIVVPAGLRVQWQDELLKKFHLTASIADTRWLLTAARDLPPDINPWSLPGVYLASYDFLKQAEVLRSLEDVRWDLLVADEVHCASPATARLDALQRIGVRARRVVLMSATPPDSEPSAFEALANIGRFDGDAPVTMFRRSKADAGSPTARKTILLPVRLSAAERLMHARLHRYTARVWAESSRREDAAARLAAMVLKKRALSTAGSLLASVRRRIALLAGRTPTGDHQFRLPFDDEEPLPDYVDDAVLAVPGLADADTERALLVQIQEAAEYATATDSKIRALRRLLRRTREPLIVFTEYRDTVAQLVRALSSWQPLTLDGSMSPAERAAVQRTFLAGGSLLLSTDAASEGLNLHHRCRAVVHFELPWMPMRLEQRTGRVDRLGQSKKVHEIILVAQHTSERFVLGPLIRRIRTAVDAGAPSQLSALSESAVGAAVFGNANVARTPPAAMPNLDTLPLRQEANAECARLETLRRIGRPAPDTTAAPGRTTLVCSGHRRRSGRLTVIVRWRLEHAGTSLSDQVLPLVVRCQFRDWPHTYDDLRAIVTDLRGQLSAAAVGRAGIRVAPGETETLARTGLQKLAHRESCLAASRSTRGELQPGLFDGRAVREAESQDRVTTLLAEDSKARMTLLSDATVEERFEIVAIHPAHGTAR